MDLLAFVSALVLVALNAFFVAAEFAIVKIRPTQVEELLRTHRTGAQTLRNILADIDSHLSACQLGITMASLGLGWIGEPAFVRLLKPIFDSLGLVNPIWTHGISVAIAFIFITMLHITVGEQAPKSLAILRPSVVGIAIAYPLRIFYFVCFPGIWLINSLSLFLVRSTGVKIPKERRELPSEEELKMIVSQARSAGIWSASRSDVLHKAMSLPTKTARHLMVPRGEVVFLDIHLDMESNLDRAMATDHTHFPLCDRSLDDVMGVIDIREVLFALRHGPVNLKELTSSPVYFAELMSAERVLAEFRRRLISMAVVVDEYGGAAGIVTPADVVTAVMGDFEDDEESEVVALPGGVYDVEGTTPLEEVEQALAMPLGSHDMRTVAGFLMTRLGRMPKIGDQVIEAGIIFSVMAVSGPHIQRIHIARHRVNERPPLSTTGT